MIAYTPAARPRPTDERREPCLFSIASVFSPFCMNVRSAIGYADIMNRGQKPPGGRLIPFHRVPAPAAPLNRVQLLERALNEAVFLTVREPSLLDDLTALVNGWTASHSGPAKP